MPPTRKPPSAVVATIDFHVTSECSQECPYCWGPQHVNYVTTTEARRIIAKVRQFGIRRIVFTGGDPLQRADIGELIHWAKQLGLEVALSTTGDRITEDFIRMHGSDIDLISLPLDGSREEINALTKEPGHFAAIMHDLEILGRCPKIDVKLCTAVTRKNLRDVRNIATLVDRWARRVDNRVFYNIFQTFPRAMKPVSWDDWLISGEEFRSLGRQIRRAGFNVRINFLSTRTLDRLYVMIFPDGSLVVPSGPSYTSFGKFLEIHDLQTVLARSEFDVTKHLRHSRRWQKPRARSSPQRPPIS